jgi:hypothetical protein
VRDLYGPLLAQALFPAFEAARGRPTVPLLRYLQATERWSRAALRDLQRGYLRRLVRHVYHHTRHYRTVMDGLGMDPEDVTSIDALHALPTGAGVTTHEIAASGGIIRSAIESADLTRAFLSARRIPSAAA